MGDFVQLMGGRNRVGTLADWSWNYLTFDRGNRALRISGGLGPPDGELVMAISLNASDPKVPFAPRH